MLGRELEPGSTILVARKVNEDGEPGDEVDITFIPGEVTPEKVTVPPDEPAAAASDDERQSLQATRTDAVRREPRSLLEGRLVRGRSACFDGASCAAEPTCKGADMKRRDLRDDLIAQRQPSALSRRCGGVHPEVADLEAPETTSHGGAVSADLGRARGRAAHLEVARLPTRETRLV